MSIETLNVKISGSGGASVSSMLSKVAGSADDADNSVDSLGSALDEMGTDALGTAADSQVLTNRLDALDEEFSDVSQGAGAAAASTSAYSTSAGSASAASATLGSVLMATTLPAVVALSTTLGPLAATLGAVAAGATAVAGGFGAVIGTGMLAYGDKLAQSNKEQLQTINQKIKRLEALEDTEQGLTAAQQQELKKLKEQQKELEESTSAAGALALKFKELKGEIAAVLLPLGKQFIPLIESAVNSIVPFTQSIVNAIGSLQPFTKALEDLGASAMTVVPQMVSAFVSFGKTALPVFMDFVSWVGQKGPAALDLLGNVVSQTAPQFKALGQATLGVMPPLLKLGTTTTGVIVPALTDMLQGLADAIAAFNDLSPSVKQAATALTVILPTTLALGTAVSTLGPAIATAAGAFGSLAAAVVSLSGPLSVLAAGVVAYQSDFAGFREEVNQVAHALGTELTETAAVAKSVLGPILNYLGVAFGALGAEGESALAPIIDLLGNKLVSAIKTAGSIVQSGLLALGQAWQDHGMTVVSYGVNAYEQAQATITQAFAVLGPAVKSALQTATLAWQTFTTTLQSSLVFQQLSGAAKAALDGLVALIQSRTTEAHKLFLIAGGKIELAFLNALIDVKQHVVQILPQVFAFIEQQTAQGIAALTAAWGQLPTLLPQPVQSALSTIESTVTSALAAITLAWTQHGADVTAAAKNAYSTLQFEISIALELIRSDIQATLATISIYWMQHGDEITAAVTNAYTTAVETVDTKLGQLRAQSGLWLLQIENAWATHKTTIISTAQSAYAAIESAISLAASAIQTVLSTAVNTLTSLWQTHKATVIPIVTQTYQQVQKTLNTAASTITALANGQWGTAFNALLTTAADAGLAIRTALVGESGNGGLIINSIQSLGGWLTANAPTVIGPGFEAIEEIATTKLTNIRIFAVGKSGNGGILNTLVTQMFSILNAVGVPLVKQGFEAIATVSISVLQNLKIALIGKSGTGGLLSTIVTEYAAFLQGTGQAMVATAFKMVGQAIRAVAVDAYNGITGNGSSVLKSIVLDIAAWFKTSGVTLLKAASMTLFETPRIAAEALYAGLIGSGGGAVFPKLVTAIQSYFMGAGRAKLKAGATALFGTIETAVSDLWTQAQAITQTAIESLSGYLSTEAKAKLQSALNTLSGAISTIESAWASHKAWVITTAQTTYSTVTSTIQGALSTAQNAITLALSTVESLWATHKTQVLTTAQTAYSAVESTISLAVSTIQSVVSGVISTLTSLWQTHKTTIVPIITTTYQQVKKTIGSAATFIKALANGKWTEAFNALQQTVTDVGLAIRTFLVGKDGNGGVIINAIKGIGSWLQSNGKTIIGLGFTAIEEIAKAKLTNLRIFAVGKSGNGGIFNTIVTQAFGILNSTGVTLIKQGFDAIAGAAMSVMTNLKIALIGKSGAGGLLTTIVQEGSDFYETTGREMIKAAFKKLGEAIRWVAIDIYNAITGNEESILKSLVLDIATWFVENGDEILKTATVDMFDAVLAAAQGLYDGLIGNSLFPEMIQAIANFFYGTGEAKLKNAAETMLDGVAGKFEDWGSDIATVVGNTMSEAHNTIANGASNLESAWNQNTPDLNLNVPDVPSLDTGGGGGGGGGGGSASGGPSSPGAAAAGPGGGGGQFQYAHTGGYINETGYAVLKAGEKVIPPADVTNRGEVSGDGGGGTTIVVERIEASSYEEGRAAMDGLLREMDSQLRGT